MDRYRNVERGRERERERERKRERQRERERERERENLKKEELEKNGRNSDTQLQGRLIHTLISKRTKKKKKNINK